MAESSRCATWDELADWWAGELEAPRSDEVEEHLLACASCARRAERVGDLVRGVEAVGRAGAFSGVATPGLVGKLERDGVRVHRYRVAPGEVVPCSVWPDDDVMAAVLDVRALAGDVAQRFDLVATFAGESTLRMSDVPLDRATGTLTWLTPASVERK